MCTIGITLTTDTDQEIQLLPNTELFSDSGIAPDGKWWVAPTDLFIKEIWHSPVGDYFKERGFRLEHDGHRIGSTQHTVIYLPTELIVNPDPVGAV